MCGAWGVFVKHEASIDTAGTAPSLRAHLMNETTRSDAAARVRAVREAMPPGGMFRDKEWLLSPQPFVLSKEQVAKLNALGPALREFQAACNELYHEGGEHAWIAKLLDQGKPERMTALGRHERWRDALPGVIRPDLILTETGFAITELDNLPGGIGLTGWLGETFGALGEEVIGGASGMVGGFAKAFPSHDILISRESAGYQPEMEWLTDKLNMLEGGAREVINPWAIEPYELSGRDIYRFFELWDTDNVEHASALLNMAGRGEINFTPPLKPYLEEKLWLALFWTPQLRQWWDARLSSPHSALLRECIPQGWVLDPTPLPLHAEWPHLGVHDWMEMKKFGNKERELVIKISGWSEKSWGSRGVHIGHDLSGEQWSAVIDEALQSFPKNPHLMQRFHRGRVIAHPLWDEAKQTTAMMQSRVRLCPYYFAHGDDMTLGGVLATVVPADKKILHGMKDAMMVPCSTG